MQVTPLDIQQHQFKVKFRGFDVHEVDMFLEEVAEAFESLLQVKQGLEDEVAWLKNENKGFKEREETFKRAMLHSQKVLEQMKTNARKSAELIVADAEVKAEKILNRAHNRLSQLHEDIAGLKRQRRQLEVQIQSIIESHTKMLEMGKEEMAARDEEDDKLKLLKKSKQL
jgi:cell division initiation protein